MRERGGNGRKDAAVHRDRQRGNRGEALRRARLLRRGDVLLLERRSAGDLPVHGERGAGRAGADDAGPRQEGAVLRGPGLPDLLAAGRVQGVAVSRVRGAEQERAGHRRRVLPGADRPEQRLRPPRQQAGQVLGAAVPARAGRERDGGVHVPAEPGVHRAAAREQPRGRLDDRGQSLRRRLPQEAVRAEGRLRAADSHQRQRRRGHPAGEAAGHEGGGSAAAHGAGERGDPGARRRRRAARGGTRTDVREDTPRGEREGLHGALRRFQSARREHSVAGVLHSVQVVLPEEGAVRRGGSGGEGGGEDVHLRAVLQAERDSRSVARQGIGPAVSRGAGRLYVDRQQHRSPY